MYQDLGLQHHTSRVADEAFRLNPALMEASILRGSVAYGRGELEGAIVHYRQVKCVVKCVVKYKVVPLCTIAR